MSPSLQNTIASTGSLPAAIAQLHNDECMELLNEALAVQSEERRASETLDQRAFRLGLRAAELDAKAEDQLAEAAQDDLVVKVRRERFGADDEPARSIASRAKASRTFAAELSAEAERLRSQAAALQRAQTPAAEVVAHLEAAE